MLSLLYSFRKTTILIPLGLLLSSLIACGSGPAMAPTSSGPVPLSTTATDSLLQQTKSVIRTATDRGSIDSLKQARTWAKQATNGERKALAHYYAALASYRIVNQLPEDDEDQREQVVEDAISHLKRATEIDPQMADAWALLSGCYGQMLGMNPMQGMSLGPKADEAMKKAKEFDADNPRIWIIDGTSDFYTPSMFGGDKERAMKKFKKAARLAEQESRNDPLMPSWGHAEAYTWMGLAHMDAERYDQARTAFEKALALNPDYAWVKEILLPKAKEQQS